jgi:hypothetical protein
MIGASEKPEAHRGGAEDGQDWNTGRSAGATMDHDIEHCQESGERARGKIN